MSVTKSLQRIETWATTYDPQFVALLRPGLTHRRIETLAAGLPFRLPEEVYELYGWHDGQSPGAFRLGLFPFGHFRLQPLRRTIGEYRVYEKTYWFAADTLDFEFRREGQNRAGEAAGWLPLFFAGGDNYRSRTCYRDHYILVLTAGGTFPLVWHPGDDGCSRLIYSSLAAMLEYMVALCEAGAVRFDKEDKPYSDYALTSEIKRRLFPERVMRAEHAYNNLPSTANTGQRISALTTLIRSGSSRARWAVAADLPPLLGGSEQAKRVTQELLTAPADVQKMRWDLMPKFLYARTVAASFLTASPI